MKIDEIQSEDCPFIVQLKNPDHFVLIAESDGAGLYKILDGSSRRGDLEMSDLAKRASGRVLCLDRASPERNIEHWDTLCKDLGGLSTEMNGSAEFSLTNNGRDVIGIKDIHVSCDCIGATYSKQSISPSEATSIRLDFDINKTMKADGEFAHKAVVELASNGNSRFTQLMLTGVVRKEFFAHIEIADFGAVQTGENREMIIPFMFALPCNSAHMPRIEVSKGCNRRSAGLGRELAKSG